MESVPWDRVNELFEEARRLPASQRDAWVRGATTDERVRAEVLSLLHSHEDDPWFIDDAVVAGTQASTMPAASAVEPAPAPPPSVRRAAAGSPWALPTAPAAAPRLMALGPASGGQFGPYRLIRELRRDAARVIFEAVAMGTGPRPRVALHLLAIDTRDPVSAAAFGDAVRVLRRLDHPGLSRQLDGGVSAEGIAYLAFEFAAGEPVDAWCRGRDLRLRECVVQALAVCDAVEHAHRQLVVHGDLRPANILVSPDGNLKVLDCGLSLFAASSPGTSATPPPAHAYMSPEQARGEPPSTATDVYSLGVLLYVLLTGSPPYELGGQTAAGARHLICDVDPELPSSVVPKVRGRALAAGLDHVAMKALRKDPRERYGSTSALAADLRAWLDHRPLSVSPERTRRRRARAAVALLVTALLACAAGLLGWQALTMRAERDAARARLAEAERAVNGARTGDKDGAAPRPAAADLRIEVARATNDLALEARRRGEPARAEALWTQALSDLTPVLDDTPADARALEAAAGVRASLGSVCRSQRRFDESLAHYREALRLRQRVASAPGAPPAAALALGDARTSVARLLLDLLEVRQRGPNDAARLREAGALLAQAGPAARAAAASPSQEEAVAEVDRQSARLRRIVNERQ